MATAKRAGRGTGRDALIDAALQLIGERGLQALTMRDIASKAGLSLGLTTYHFPDRDTLLREALQRFAHTEIQRYEQLLTSLAENNASVEQITSALISGVRGAFSRPGYTTALLELYLAAARDPALAAIATGCIHGYQRLTQDALTTAGMPAERAATTARQIMVLIDGYAVHAAAAGTPTRLPAGLTDAIHALTTN